MKRTSLPEKINLKFLTILLITFLSPSIAFATSQIIHESIDLTNSALGYIAITIFIIAYILVMS